ncbi:MAG: hypothetical protein ACKVS6_07110 [Planctomycetota bacterium]
MDLKTEAGAPASPQPPASGKIRLESWTWGRAFFAVFLVLIFAWGLGVGIRKWYASEDGDWLKSVSVYSGMAAAFVFLLISWKRAMEFFLSIRVGVAILVFFVLGSVASVVVHPRDPEKYNHIQKVEDREYKHRDDFQWATGFFFYHLLHPYGWGMPSAEAPEAAKGSLDRISKRYSNRIAKQEESGMKSAVTGQLRGQEIKAFIIRHRALFNQLYDICLFLQLSGTATGKGAWSSDWFSALMGLLFIIVFTNTFRRGIARAIAQGGPGLGFITKLPAAIVWDLKSLFTIARIGFLATHLGVLTALVSGFHSRLTERRGIVQLSINPEREKLPVESVLYQTYSGERLFFGPPDRTFAVRLADFHADYRDTLDISFVEDPEPKTNPSYRFYEIWKGRQIGLEYGDSGKESPKTIVRVLEHWPRANVELDITERPAGVAPASVLESSGSALKVDFSYRGIQQSGFLVSGLEGLAVFDVTPGLRLRYESAANENEQKERLAAPFEGDRLGSMLVVTAERPDEPSPEFAIVRGESFTFETPEGKATARIANALPDARLITLPNGETIPQFLDSPMAETPPLAPGVELEITAPDGRKIRKQWYYEDERHSVFNDNNIIEVGGTRAKFVINWDHWRSPAVERYRLVSAPGCPLLLGRVGGGDAREVKVNEVVKLPNTFSFTITRRADRPKIVANITEKPGNDDEPKYFFDKAPPAARIEVDGPEGKQQFLIAASEFANFANYSNRMRVRIFENRADLPREWKSNLEFLEVDPVTNKWTVRSTQMIRVNDYAYYNGYRFFQTDAKTEFPGYSGIGIVYDPGIEGVLIGLWSVVIGVAFVFLVKPWLVKINSSKVTT